jgi:hypothetical protein
MNQVQSTRLIPAFSTIEPSSAAVDLEERISNLRTLRLHFTDCEKDGELYGFVKEALRKSQCRKREVDERLAFQKDYFLTRLTKQLPQCIEHAVLDSRSDVPGSPEGLSEGTAIQFFLTMLHFFDPQNAFPEVEHLKNVLDDHFELWVYQEDHRYPREDRLEDSAQLFHSKVACLLKRLTGGAQYFFFPLASFGHAMVGKVEWICDEGFRLTIINKGECPQFREGEIAADLIYLGLTEEEVLTVIMANFNLCPFTSTVYANIDRALPPGKRERYMGREHGLHKRASCSIKSLSGAIHGVLPAGIYRAFKVFFTNRLMNGMEPGPQFDAAYEILIKRKTKYEYLNCIISC